MKNYIFKLSVFFGVLLLVVTLAYKFSLTNSTNIATTKTQAKRITPLAYTGQNLLNEFNKTTIDNYPTAAGTFDLATMASQITSQLTQAFSNAAEKPLPLVANWNVGIPEYSDGLDPMYMINRLANGEHIVPTWKLDPYYNDTIGLSYYEESIKKAAELGLPLVFILPSPESALIKDDVYFSMDKSNNPNVITPDGTVLPKLSPFGPNSLWNEVGGQWSTTSLMAQLQAWYPNPPLVLFIDEDSSTKLLWSELSSSSRYQTQYPQDGTDEFKRTLVNAQWVEKYRQLHKGFRDGFTNNNWKQNAKFISRNLLAVNMGATSEWQKSATTTHLHANIWPLTADGLTVDVALDGNKALLNNLPFMLDEAKSINPDFVTQLSIDAHQNIVDADKYRGYTQFALWFLRPSIIRQTPNKSTKDEINPLFQQVVDSVELVNGSDILADFWKNGKLVKTGDSNYNLNIPTEYQSVPREFLLKTNANSTVWAFALEKGVAPNREWLVYVQSPEGNLSDVPVSVPDVGDILVDSSKRGNFYSMNESEPQKTSFLSINSAKTIDTNTTNLNGYVSPYLEPINLPTCNANDPDVQFIKTMSDWSHINDAGKSIFCVSPGDYSEKTITLTTSGTKDKKRYIILYNGNDIHPGKLDKKNLAKVSFIIKDTNYWTIDRMAYWESPTTLIPIKIINSSNNLINRYFMDNVGNGIILYPGSSDNSIQNCRIQRENITIHNDRAAIALYNDGKSDISIKNTKVINNEIKNFVDGFQAVRSSTKALNINYEGTILDNNIIFIDNTIYTDCKGNHDINGNCAYAENAIDLKSGSHNINNPIRIINNKMWGYKKSDTTNSDLSDPGVALVGHYDLQNIIIANNYILNSDFGININSPIDNYSVQHAQILNNRFDNIKNYSIGLVNAFDVNITDNNITNCLRNNKLQYGPYWLLLINSEKINFKNNKMFSLNNKEPLLLNTEISSSKNQYYRTLDDSSNSNTILKSKSDTIYSETNPEANASIIKFNINKYTEQPIIYQINP